MPVWVWFVFVFGTLALIALDLGVLTRRPVVVRPREAATGLLMWFVAAVAVGVAIASVYRDNPLGLGLREVLSQPLDVAYVPGPAVPVDGTAAFLQYITGYAVELSLSLDNLAVLTLLLAHFRIPAPYVSRAVFWSLLLSVGLRLGLIQGGAAMLRAFAWTPYFFGGLLALAMLRTLLLPDPNSDLTRTTLLRTVRRWLPLAADCNGQRLTSRVNGRLAFTPIAGVALCYAVADVTFALDSIPAIFAVTQDPFIAFAASAMAILALRPLAALLAGVGGRIRYGRISVVFVLLWVAAKIFLEDYRKADTVVTLCLVVGITGVVVAASLIHDKLAARKAGGAIARPAAVADLAEAALASRRHLRKLIVLIVGTLIVLIGIVIIGPLPGPGGIPIVLAGLGLLATEFIWAQRMLQQVKEKGKQLQQATDKMAEQANPWMVPVVFGIYWGGIWLLATFFYSKEWNKSGNLVWLASIGIFLPIAYWGYGTLRAAMKARRAKAAGTPTAPASVPEEKSI